MKKVILLILMISFLSCKESSAEKSIKTEEKSKLEKDYEFADIFLQFDAEKIGLLSIIKGVHQEKTNAILRDYLAKTIGSSTLLSIEDPNYVVKVIDTIALKNNTSKKLTASIIFSYQYEMITEEDVIEQYSRDKEYYEKP